MSRRRYANLRWMQSLDPTVDYRAIYRCHLMLEFPGDYQVALQRALYRGWGLPRVAELEARSGGFLHQPLRRAIDTAMLVLEVLDQGVDSPRGHEAINVTRRAHRPYWKDIDANDFLHVLAGLWIVPLDHLATYGWRPVTDVERLAGFYFYRELGRRVGARDIPDDADELEQWYRDYGAENLRPTDASRRLWAATSGLMADRVPGPQALGRALGTALLDPITAQAIGAPAAHPAARWTVHTLFALRRRALRWAPPRRRPVFHPGIASSAHPNGYRLDELGSEYARATGDPEPVTSARTTDE